MNNRDRFDKFTDNARKVLQYAQEEAQRFQHNYIGTEHILLGLVRGQDSTALQVLQERGIEPARIREAVEFIIGRGDRIVLQNIGLTPRAKKVIELAVDEARRMNHRYIGTEHLLLGLVREGEGIGAGVLESLGVNLERLRRETIQVLNRKTGTPGAFATPVQEDASELSRQASYRNDKFDKFTPDGRRALAFAQEEAQRLQHNYIGTEHLLLGLVRQADALAAQVLQQNGVTLEAARAAVTMIIGRGDRIILGEIGLTPRAKKVIELAVDEAQRLSSATIGTEHILLGLISEGQGIAVGVIESLNADLAMIRQDILRRLA